jgi:hypothetical protein
VLFWYAIISSMISYRRKDHEAMTNDLPPWRSLSLLCRASGGCLCSWLGC